MSVFAAALAMLLSLPAYSQAGPTETSDTGCGLEVSLISRAEYSSHVDYSPLAASSFNALLDATFSDRLSFSSSFTFLNPWPGDLYDATFHSDVCDWCQWANLTYDFGPVALTAGKLLLNRGTVEYSKYDFDQYWELCSYNWLNTNTYQYGMSLGAPLGEYSQIALTVASSPYNVRPFDQGLVSASLYFQDNFLGMADIYSSISADQMANEKLGAMFCFGADLHLSDSWHLGGDLYADLTSDKNCYMPLPSTIQAFLGWQQEGKYSLEGRFGYDADPLFDFERIYGGLVGNWYPVESIRVHALAAYDSFVESALFNLGLTWTISL